MSDQDRLGEALRHRADDLTDQHPLTLADVQGRARGIRRRRIAVSGLAAAAVLAIAVPAGLVVGGQVGRDDRTEPPVATHTSDPTPTDTPTEPSTPSPSGAAQHQVVLTTNVEAKGTEPGIPYLFDGSITLADGSTVPVKAAYQDVVSLGDQWLAVRRDDNGNAILDTLDSSGTVTDSTTITGPLAVSEDGSVVAWGTPRGEVMTQVAGQQPVRINNLSEPNATPMPVGVLGSGSCLETEGKSCTVFWNSGQGGAYYSSSHGITDQAGENLLKVNGVAPNGDISAVVSADDQGSCSIVQRADSYKMRWSTCDYTLGKFSPDGKYVIGRPAYLDGIGDGFVAILDAKDGTVLADFRPAEGADFTFLNNAAWDVDDTLLATVWEKDHWSLMRLAPDGGLFNTSRGGLANGTNMDSVPLFFATRP